MFRFLAPAFLALSGLPAAAEDSVEWSDDPCILEGQLVTELRKVEDSGMSTAQIVTMIPEDHPHRSLLIAYLNFRPDLSPEGAGKAAEDLCRGNNAWMPSPVFDSDTFR